MSRTQKRQKKRERETECGAGDRSTLRAAWLSQDRLIDLNEFCNVFTSGAAAGDYESLQVL